MSFFKKVDGEGAVVVEKGVYKQVELFERDGLLYVKVGGGFVKLMADGSTSKLGGSLKLDFMSWNGDLGRMPYGYLAVGGTKGAAPLAAPDKVKLLGAPE